MSQYNEDALVQQTTAEYLENELGWRSVYAYNHEDYGPGSLLGRNSDREILLKKILREKLIELNPDLPVEAYDEAIRKIETVQASQSLLATNREKYNLLRDGVRVTFRDEDGQRVRQRLKLFNFENPEKNDFLCVRELWVRGDLYRRRADIVGFVNGVPLLFMELKSIYRDIRAAYEENFKDYKDTVPHLFHHNAVVVLANGKDAKIGTLSTRYEQFHEWKRLSEENAGAVDMETLLKGICEKSNFMDMVENFILFDESAGETKKILARNHQFLGVNRAVEALRDRKKLNGKLGVFWHTQGAGKSYSMVMFTRKVHRRLGGNFTFLVLTDRQDLDAQIYKTFAGCGVVDNEHDPCRASSNSSLSQLLSQRKGHLFSLIHKFNEEVDPREGYTQRDDLVVITDEAHRTQYGTLALNMRNALPNASFIGFTGTPLFKDDEITRRVFGGYVSTYDFQRAVNDKATVPLYYDARGEKLGVAVGDLNERIAEKIEELEIEDIDVQQRLERELKRDYHIITAATRLDQVARDFVNHYSAVWESGKVMLVCIDKVTCVRMHKLIDFYWDQRIRDLEKNLKKVADEQEEQHLRKQIEWMRQTRMAVVVSEEQGEVEKFRNWGLDIEPHRKLIKEGMDLPEDMRKLPQFRNIQRLALDDAFKEERHPFRIAIVCAMWLTGFDVPSLSTLYLDKPLKAHTLMQAVARANRVKEGKNNGLIVDYCGILKNLRNALATFAGTNDGGDEGGGEGLGPTQPKEELLEELEEAVALVRTFLKERDADLADIIKSGGFKRISAIKRAKEAANENDEVRKRFGIMCRAVFTKFKACITVEGVNKHRNDYEAINAIYKSLQKDTDQADIGEIIIELHAVIENAIAVKSGSTPREGAIYDISKIDFDKLRQEFQKFASPHTAVQNLKTAIEKRLKILLQQNPLRTDMQQHYEEVVTAYNREKDSVTIEQTFEALLKLVQEMGEEEQRATREGLDEESLAIFDLLKKSELSAQEIGRIKKVSIELLKNVKARIKEIDKWESLEATRDSVRLTIKNFLWSDATGLPEQYSEDEVQSYAEEVYRHIYRVYPKLPSPFYRRESVA